jgi:hypothetical protein
MTDPARPVPPPVQTLLDNPLRRVEQSPPRDLHAVFADRINYCRQFDQSKMPPWRDPRDPRGR